MGPAGNVQLGWAAKNRSSHSGSSPPVDSARGNGSCHPATSLPPGRLGPRSLRAVPRSQRELVTESYSVPVTKGAFCCVLGQS